jgi:hypothetical protein
VLAAALAACGLGWETVDRCGDAGCAACDSDDDCVTRSSCCAEELYCSHRDDSPLVCQLGCSVPDPPPCLCAAGRCRFSE